MKIKDYEPRRAHKIIQKIQKQMTADERNYWWRLTHITIQTKKRQSEWKKTEDRVCKALDGCLSPPVR